MDRKYKINVEEMPEEKEKEFKQLQQENEEIRKKITEIIGFENPLYSPLWVAISDLINNEIEQEQECNK